MVPLAVIVGLVGLVVATILAIAGRRGEDPDDRGIDAVYLFTVLTVTLFLTLLAAVATVASLAALVTPGAEWPLLDVGPWTPLGFGGTAGLASVLLAGASGLAYMWHGRRSRELLASADPGNSAVRRIHRAHLHLVCAFAVLVLVLAAPAVVLGAVGVLLPGSRAEGFGRFVAGGFQAAAALAIFRVHWARRGRPTPVGSGG